jgi:hypothetical protein
MIDLIEEMIEDGCTVTISKESNIFCEIKRGHITIALEQSEANMEDAISCAYDLYLEDKEADD